jgi:hypothetical protein
MARIPSLLAFAWLAFFSLGAAAAETAEPAEMASLPSAAEARGVGAGKIFVVPVTAAAEERLLDPKLFELHAAAPGSRKAAPVLEAGKWLALPAPELDLWLEGGGLISPWSLRVARPAAGAPGVVVKIPVGEAGRVKFPFGADGELRPELHLWSAGPFRDRGGQLQGELARVVPLPLDGPVAMPAGRAVAAVYEPLIDRYLMMSEPFEVKGGETAEIDMEPEEIFAQLILDLPLPTPAAEGTKVDLRQAGTMEPDLIVQSRHRVTAFWYSLFPATEATLSVDAGDYLLPPWRETMRGAVILAEHGPLAPWPTLELEVKLPAALNGRELELEARGPHYTTYEELEFTGDYRHTFRRLPPGEIELLLETPLGTVLRKVDFSNGESQHVFWEPELLALEGTVYYDGEPRRATLTFTVDTAVDTDEKGRYRVELVGAVRYVQVKVDGAPGDPHSEHLAEPVTTSGRLDIRVPAPFYSVRVVDSAGRQGIERATVEIRSVYRHQPKEGDSAGQPLLLLKLETTRTDGDGKAWLPPLEPGTFELTAEAGGYLAAKPLTVEAPAKPEKQEFELALEKIEGLQPLELKLASGAPAARISVALYDESGSHELWRDMADAEGKLEVPLAPGQLLVSGGEASFLATAWPPQGDTPRMLRLPPDAGSFLMLQVKDGQGRPIDGVQLALYLDGKVYHGALLGFLLQAPSVTNQGGLVIARHLPPRPFGLVAFSPFLPRPPAGAKPQTIPYPWPHLVELRLAE